MGNLCLWGFGLQTLQMWDPGFYCRCFICIFHSIFLYSLAYVMQSTSGYQSASAINHVYAIKVRSYMRKATNKTKVTCRKCPKNSAYVHADDFQVLPKKCKWIPQGDSWCWSVGLMQAACGARTSYTWVSACSFAITPGSTVHMLVLSLTNTFTYQTMDIHTQVLMNLSIGLQPWTISLDMIVLKFCSPILKTIGPLGISQLWSIMGQQTKS